MKIGKFDESIELYKKALSVNASFVASYIGIATCHNYKGNHEDARKQLEKLYELAHNDGARRTAYFTTAVSYVDEGNLKAGLGEIKKQYELAEKINDAAAMAGDLNTMGNILLEAGELGQALYHFEKSVKVIQNSKLSQQVKENAKRGFVFNSARVALKKEDFATAKAKSEKFQKLAQELNNPLQVMLSHQLAGMIAFTEKDYDKAIEELKQANLQNPYNIFRLAEALKAKGNKDKAKKLYKRAINFNSLNNLNQAFVHAKVKK